MKINNKTLRGNKIIFLNNHHRENLFETLMSFDLNNDINKYLPYVLPNETLGLELLKDFIDNNKKIGIVGDFDVDGSCATALLIRFLQLHNANFCYYTPNRMTDGYGISSNIVRKLKELNVELVITLDNGTTAYDAINTINELNMKSIVIDHHAIGSEIPSTILINPHLNEGNSVFKDLCATSVLFVFLCKLNKLMNKKVNMNIFLDFVAIATVCDVMPMRHLNKALVNLGLIEMNNNIRFCFKILLFNNLTNITTETIGFYLGPCINAPGRMGDSTCAVNLMISNNDKEIIDLCQRVMDYNMNRKSIERDIMSKVPKISVEKKSIFVFDDWHEGVIGIISGKLKESYGKPTCVVSVLNSTTAKGSMRSPSNLHIGNFIKSAINKGLIQHGGGHNCAGGFTTSLNKLNELSNFLEESVVDLYIPTINVFSTLSLHAIDEDFMSQLYKLGPFGPTNEHPMFLFLNCKISDVYIFGNHMSITVANMFIKFKSMIFNMDSNHLRVLKDMETAHIIAYPYRLKKEIQIRIIDIIAE